MKKWYALYVKPRAEKKVQYLLCNKDIENYLPLKKTLHQWKYRKKWVEIPVISGYIFIKINMQNRLESLKTDFVLGFVKYLKQDAIIPEEQINMMKCMLGQSEHEIEVDQIKYNVGQKVRVIAGPLMGLQGNMVSVNNKNKMVVHLEQLHTNFIVQLPHYQLEKATN